jgi:hypothetical protein
MIVLNGHMHLITILFVQSIVTDVHVKTSARHSLNLITPSVHVKTTTTTSAMETTIHSFIYIILVKLHSSRY